MRVLLSIRPEYAEKILDGTKRFEFRRRIFQNHNVTTVVIYSTMPVGKIVGEFSIKTIHSGRPQQIWSKTKSQSGITYDYFSRYFSGREISHAIEVDRVKRYSRPRKITEFLTSGVPPQSYAYLDAT